MISISNEALKLVNMSIEDYLSYCKKHSLKPYVKSTKALFFYLVINKKIYKNKEGELIENGKEKDV